LPACFGSFELVIYMGLAVNTDRVPCQAAVDMGKVPCLVVAGMGKLLVVDTDRVPLAGVVGMGKLLVVDTLRVVVDKALLWVVMGQAPGGNTLYNSSLINFYEQRFVNWYVIFKHMYNLFVKAIGILDEADYSIF
jgi:hypothetical protein